MDRSRRFAALLCAVGLLMMAGGYGAGRAVASPTPDPGPSATQSR